jgi:hypothetical protein
MAAKSWNPVQVAGNELAKEHAYFNALFRVIARTMEARPVADTYHRALSYVIRNS